MERALRVDGGGGRSPSSHPGGPPLPPRPRPSAAPGFSKNFLVRGRGRRRSDHRTPGRWTIGEDHGQRAGDPAERAALRSPPRLDPRRPSRTAGARREAAPSTTLTGECWGRRRSSGCWMPAPRGDASSSRPRSSAAYGSPSSSGSPGQISTSPPDPGPSTTLPPPSRGTGPAGGAEDASFGTGGAIGPPTFRPPRRPSPGDAIRGTDRLGLRDLAVHAVRGAERREAGSEESRRQCGAQ